MTTHFQAPLSVPELAERATNMMDEACALARLASDLAEFERTTGRKLFVSEGGEQAEPEAFQFRSSQTDSGVEVENAAQADGDKLGEAEPIDTGSAETVTEPQPAQEAPAAAPTPPAAPEAPAKPAARPAASTATAKPKTDDRLWGKLNLPERQIVKHLDRLPKTFTPQDDLRLAELLTNGSKIDAAAAFLEVEADAALTRWKSFLCEDVIGANGKPTIDGQKQLLNALRYRVETADA